MNQTLRSWSGVLAAPPEVSFLIHHGGGHRLADGRDVGVVARACWEGAVAEALAGIDGRLGTRAGARGRSGREGHRLFMSGAVDRRLVRA